MEDLFKAYYDARRHKRNTYNQLEFETNYELNLVKLYEELITGKYEVGSSIAFIVQEPTMREIFAADFRDRIIHHLVFNYINPWWDKRFINDSYSCRVAKGTLYGQKRLQNFMLSATDNGQRTAYIMKLDIAGYFMNIKKSILYEKMMWGLKRQFLKNVERDKRDKRDNRDNLFLYNLCQNLIEKIIFNDPTQGVKIKGKKSDWNKLPRNKSLFNCGSDKGLPIGNLTSQLASNIYLDSLDRFIIYGLGIKRYGRYVDDFYLIDPDKKRLLEARNLIKGFLKDELDLTLHPKKEYLQECRKGVDFVGVKIFLYHRLPSKRLLRKFKQIANYYYRSKKKKTDKIFEKDDKLTISYISYRGHLQHMKHFNLVRNAKG